MTDINVISHRGANKLAPQNTLTAFEKSLEIGCDGFETDIHLTKDGIPVLCHNFTIDATSNGIGAIKDMTLEELRSYDFGSYFDSKFAGTKIPTLEEFLSLSEKAGSRMKVLDIELKSEVFGMAGSELAEKTIEAVKAHGLFDALLISSFDPEILVTCKKIDRRCKTGLLYSEDKLIGWKISVDPIGFARRIAADALHPQYLYVNKRYVKRAHEAGIMVNPWTIDSSFIAKRMIRCGVDGLITDLPGQMNMLLKNR